MKHYRFKLGCRETIQQLFHHFEGETRRFSNLAILVTSIAPFLGHSSQNSFSIVHALTSKDLKKSFFAGAPFFVHVNIACFPPVCYTNVTYRHQNIELLTILLLPSNVIAYPDLIVLRYILFRTYYVDMSVYHSHSSVKSYLINGQNTIL